ncbi:MAG TPA: ankyrin repeat domain-containing protein [Bryobacteraceae bacterium]|nr:ankyrin repeat domain-containing protein [Bryobacteraceae bacterium]
MSNRRRFLAAAGLTPAALAVGQNVKADPAPDPFQLAYKGDIPGETELARLNPAFAKLRSPEGKTPLHYAVEGGHVDMVFFLTIQGADLSAGPESPLLAAVDYPDAKAALAMSQALLGNASDPNARRADGRTAIELASARGYTDIVELLAHRGATGPLADAVKTERVYFGQRFSFDANGRPYKAEDIDGLPQSFINEFVRLSHADVDRVKHLARIAPGLVHGRATWDESGIEAAAHMGLAPLARHLADLGAPVSICTATLLGLRDRVESLVKSDPNCVRERGAHDIALLAYTAYSDQRVEIADFLLRSGAGVNAKGLGITALHLAARKGYLELADVLLSHGAEVNGPSPTPLAVAVKAKNDKMADFLKSRGGSL